MSNKPRGLDPVRETLSNDVTVLVQELRTTPTVTISASINAGTLFESADTLGVAYFLPRVIDRGAARRSADEIAEVLDLKGVSLSVNVTRNSLTLSCNVLSEDFMTVLKILAEVIRDPTCSDNEILKRRGEVLTAIHQDEDNPAVKAVERLMELLYGGAHPYGRRVKGTQESVNRIDRKTLIDFHRQNFAPSVLSVVVVGDIDAGSAVEQVTHAFGDWRATPANRPLLAAPVSASQRRRVVVPMMNKSQADVGYGFTTVPRTDPSYYAYWLMANILGQYGMGGRLGHSIREQQGMAYYAFCSFEADQIAGPLVVRAGVNATNVDRVVESIDREITKISCDGVQDVELENSKRYLIGSMPRTLETNAGIAGFLQTVERFDLGLNYDQRLPDLLEGVTRDDVNAAAAHTLSPDRAAMVIAGPYAGPVSRG